MPYYQYTQGRTLHVDKYLSNIAMNYRPAGMIVDRILPTVPVMNQSDLIKTYSQADLYRIENAKRSPGTEANRIQLQVGSDYYFANNYALKGFVPIEDRKNADPGFIRDLEVGKVESIKDKLMMGWELRVAQTVTTSTNVNTVYTVGSGWTDLVNADPFGDLNTALDYSWDSTGYRANRMVIGEQAWRNLSRNENIINKVNATGVEGGDMNAKQRQIAELFELEEVLVGRAQYNSADEGIALNLTPMWSDTVFLYYAPARPSLEEPSYGYSFRWTKPGLANMNVERHPYDSRTKSDEFEVGYYQAEKVTAPSLGITMINVNTST